MAPESKASQRKRQSSTESLRHRNISGRTVSSPVRQELLSSYCSGTGKKHCFSLSPLSFQKLKYCLIIKVCIVIVHFHWIRMVKVFNILHRYPLTEVCLKAVHTHIQKSLQLFLIPGHCV